MNSFVFSVFARFVIKWYVQRMMRQWSSWRYLCLWENCVTSPEKSGELAFIISEVSGLVVQWREGVFQFDFILMKSRVKVITRYNPTRTKQQNETSVLYLQLTRHWHTKVLLAYRITTITGIFEVKDQGLKFYHIWWRANNQDVNKESVWFPLLIICVQWHIKHERLWITTFPYTEKRVENTTRGGVFLTNFEVFGNVVKHC